MKLIKIAILALMLTGCATQKSYKTYSGNSTPDYKSSQPFFLWGIGQTQDVDIKKVCKGKDVAAVNTTQTFVDGLLGVITFGIYTPRSVEVYCE